jgi:hypothetical protein
MDNDFLTEEEITKWYGPRCTENVTGCVVCEAWNRHDLINHMRWRDTVTRYECEPDMYQIDLPLQAGFKGNEGV